MKKTANPGIFFILLVIILLSCEKEDNIEFESIYPDLFPLNNTVNYIFPPQKFKIILNTPPEITCYYTTNGEDPAKDNGNFYDPEEGILLDVGTYTVKVIIYQDGIRADTIFRRKYIIYSK